MTADGARAGLRERKKKATREALALAALRLAAERGLENMRVEDIAAEVGVSARTFSNYFAGKTEALTARHSDRLREAADTLLARPREEPLWEAITYSVLAAFGGQAHAGGVPGSGALDDIRLLANEPGLRAEFVKAGLAGGSELAVAIASRSGTDVDTDMFPRLAAATTTTAVQVAGDIWLEAGPTSSLFPIIERALHELSAGMPDPSRKASYQCQCRSV
ncbi:TetR family transcriptional regulator [Nocardia sp. NPDC050193]